MAKRHAGINGCNLTKGAIQVAHDYYAENNIPPHLATVYWKKVSSLMGNKHHNNGANANRVDDKQLSRQLGDLFCHTVNGMA